MVVGYREIPENRVLRFPSTAGFKGWKSFFTEESTTHPAKMNLRLLRWILKTYTSEGEVICDPMAGTGSTIILAAIEGRHGIAVEYEEHFCKMIRDNIKRTERQSSFKARGKMFCIQGDARELSKLLKESDVIITSPPYGSDNANLRERKDKSAQSVLSTTGVRAVPLEEDNIGVLEYGDVDAVITSPPYEGSYLGGGDQEARRKRLIESGHDVKDFFGGKARDATLKHYGEVDTIVTSPPYADSVKRGDEGPSAHGEERPTYEERLADPKVYSNDPKNIGNLRHGEINSIVTSPPYEGSMESRRHVGGIVERENLRDDGGKMSLPVYYSEDKDNIGNLKSESYLEAMLQCYREFYKVLKNSGKLILVTKNFIRNKAVVRLDEDTIKLCEASGFTLKDRWYFKLPQISFWRILYQKKFPSVPKIEYEDVLVFEKEST